MSNSDHYEAPELNINVIIESIHGQFNMIKWAAWVDSFFVFCYLQTSNICLAALDDGCCCCWFLVKSKQISHRLCPHHTTLNPGENFGLSIAKVYPGYKKQDTMKHLLCQHLSFTFFTFFKIIIKARTLIRHNIQTDIKYFRNWVGLRWGVCVTRSL